MNENGESQDEYFGRVSARVPAKSAVEKENPIDFASQLLCSILKGVKFSLEGVSRRSLLNINKGVIDSLNAISQKASQPDAIDNMRVTLPAGAILMVVDEAINALTSEQITLHIAPSVIEELSLLVSSIPRPSQTTSIR